MPFDPPPVTSSDPSSSDPSSEKVILINHPLVQHKLTIMRQVETHTQDFRRLLKEIAMLLAYEVTRDLPLKKQTIKTPLAEMEAPMLAADKKMVIVSILRAGQGLLDGMIELIPTAKVGHIGLYREPTTLTAVEYYLKLPLDVEHRDMLVVDPMLATGNSAVAAVDRLKEANPASIKFVCLLAAPEGIQHFHEQHPDVPIYTAAIDERLDDHGYIVPGLGDAGDRLYGTR
ncbi:MAG: uracil phosphoribosyltransferase [Leptolyngbya sp. IPPAS B-1204]|uniref:Uracil phosphoribosyltransferase n=1 Tax=Leptolyngbya sp. NK1-12 TaxID=2547451 RepID=A0AA97AJQ8_9CYAN|nr:uracil phosphoribosyltransferase [Leptolyngbya sp. NK1-12]MBF2051118.1 uracil phosphoribosyltransferase [Elainella sp. C42_A2020_010]RNJ65187.1 MAG: uracil phosphoribosyltransferase [Leptolyngbya sp. IPPAS B-1204]WNZ22907.1 uracil phosphoribosyltransferase [Leptolyngbya sp. NK1-12]